VLVVARADKVVSSVALALSSNPVVAIQDRLRVTVGEGPDAQPAQGGGVVLDESLRLQDQG
jgi:hypothetical protein